MSHFQGPHLHGQHYHPSGYGAPGPAPTVPTNRFSVVNGDLEDAYGGVANGAVDHGEANRTAEQIGSLRLYNASRRA